jgi:DNA-directed RNA polymerase subunit RPC12/RpoP
MKAKTVYCSGCGKEISVFEIGSLADIPRPVTCSRCDEKTEWQRKQTSASEERIDAKAVMDEQARNVSKT